MQKVDDGLLLKIGLKKALLDKLNDVQTKSLIAFAMDHIKTPNLLRMLTQIISMEIGNKQGAILLAMHNIVTATQLKNLTVKQVHSVLEEYTLHHDPAIAIKLAKEMLVLNQQEKLYTMTDGNKGEYYIYKDEQNIEDELV